MSSPAPRAAVLLAGLASGAVYGEHVAACVHCSAPLVELAQPLRLTGVDEDGGTAEVLLTHGHGHPGPGGQAGPFCANPAPRRCAAPMCPLHSTADSAWCWLCGPAADGPARYAAPTRTHQALTS